MKYISKIIIFLFIFFIKIYQKLFSPFFGKQCRFTPSCSEYSSQAILKHGIFRGVYLSSKRILYCNPYGSSGYDPVPEKNKEIYQK